MASLDLQVTSVSEKSVSPIFGATIFLSAFLLFQVQLIIGKAILPWFGGTAAVWTTCMLVFQVLLLAGYAYAHAVSSRLCPRMQARVHMIVLAVALLALLIGAFVGRAPILPGAGLKPVQVNTPVMDIIRLLAIAVGAPFFVLSTTGSLLQRWYAHAAPGQSPYRLYALSNAGSLLGLLSYPFLLEPSLTLRAQAWIWSSLFVVFAVACVFVAKQVGTLADSSSEIAATNGSLIEEEEAEPGILRYLLWLALPACASIMLLATTNRICQEVAVIPFLWILPLSIYLLSFILTFDSPKWYRRQFFHPLYLLAMFGAVNGLMNLNYTFMRQINLALLAMFAVCMISHGELVRLRPKTKHLTAFYLMVALGGAIGGFSVSIIAPHVFPGFYEYQVALWACGMLAFAVLMLDRESWLHTAGPGVSSLVVLAVSLLPLAFAVVSGVSPKTMLTARYSAILAVIGLLTIFSLFRSGFKAVPPKAFKAVQFATLIFLCAFGWLLVRQVQLRNASVLDQRRNFFGVIAVFDRGPSIVLRHGDTVHGSQYKDPAVRDTPTTYYVVDSGIGLLLREHPRDATGEAGKAPLRVGLVGLGAGTLAAYGHAGDTYRFYEINPQVVDLSIAPKAPFTFLKDSPAAIEISVGDARLSMEREPAQKYDVLVLDAFSSDSIPVHLLTREAMQIYKRHLRGPHSVIAFHISNRSLDLRPVLVALAKDAGLGMIRAGARSDKVVSDWVLMCEDKDWLMSIPAIHDSATTITLNREAPLWTDDYSNLAQLLKF